MPRTTTPPSPALAAPFRLLSAAGIAAAERASPKFLADLARHPAVIDAVSALTGTCMVPAPERYSGGSRSG